MEAQKYVHLVGKYWLNDNGSYVFKSIEALLSFMEGWKNESLPSKKNKIDTKELDKSPDTIKWWIGYADPIYPEDFPQLLCVNCEVLHVKKYLFENESVEFTDGTIAGLRACKLIPPYEYFRKEWGRAVEPTNFWRRIFRDVEKYTQIKLDEQKDHYEEQLAILSEQVPKGAVDFDRIEKHLTAGLNLKTDIEKSLYAYECSINNYKK